MDQLQPQRRVLRLVQLQRVLPLESVQQELQLQELSGLHMQPTN